MHSQTDSSNSKYSFLIFDSRSDTIEDGRLFNYEISMSRVSSPMVVLSACNTATGNLYHGEGVMSLTRGFILAGASSVVNTFWDVNDDTSAKIMIDFYYYLSKGDDKDEALRKAKLNYLKNTPPTYANPYYWAAYEVMGNKSPVKRSPVLLLLFGGFLVLASVLFVGYRRWFR
jgi:CHAT domain-containing protein